MQPKVLACPIISEVYQTRFGWFYDQDRADDGTLIGFMYDGLTCEHRRDKHLYNTGAVIITDIYRMQLLPSSEPFEVADGYFLTDPSVRFTLALEHFNDVLMALDAPEFPASNI